ncbi:MAG: hypothetical protein EA409_11370, partial [Saprospirales bacterium]
MRELRLKTNSGYSLPKPGRLLFLVVAIFSFLQEVNAQIFVNHSAAGANDGSSWEDAYENLQDALIAANSGDSIWVVAGTYKPSSWPAGCSGCSTDRDFVFMLKDGLSLFGGFAGFETLLNERNVAVNETILSGDIGIEGDNSDNTYHVVLSVFSTNSPITLLDGFTIRDGNADGIGTVTFNGGSAPRNDGGGVYVDGGNNFLRNNTIYNNSAAQNGGGISIFEGVNVISNNDLNSNEAERGGGIYTSQSNTSLSDNIVANNTAVLDGGGIYISFGNNTLTNNSIYENQAANGAGVYLSFGNQHLNRNNISGNSASSGGGGIFTSQGVHTMINNAISGNTVSGNGGGIHASFSNNSHTNNTISGNNASAGGGLYTFGGSNSITNTTIWGNSSGLLNSTDVPSGLSVSNSIVQGGFTPCLACPGTDGDIDPLFIEEIDLNNLPTTSGDWRLQECSPAIDAGDNSALTAADSLDLAGEPRVRNATGGPSAIVDIGAYEFQGTLGNANTLYVDSSNTSPGNGLSWDCAFTDLQQALDVAQPGDSIWVAAGTYYPTSNSLDREATFQLRDGVAIYGGFAGNESSLMERDWETNVTILSGDINQSNSLDGNSYTVVTGSGTHSTAIIDGFTITGGNADATSGSFLDPNRSGGGIYNNGGSPSIINCTISGNRANIDGGGIYNMENSNPTIFNSTISSNQAIAFWGGGIYNQNNSSPTITNSTISGNLAGSNGGGIYNNANSSPIITNSTISGNEANFGGGIYNFFNSSPAITNSIIWNNSVNGNTSTTSASVANASNSNPEFSFSLIGNSGGSGSGWESAIGTDGLNNIDADPLFIEDIDLDSIPTTSGNLRLQACSPAIDWGENSALSAADSLDLAGEPRVRNATGGPSAIVDMGAYEFQGTLGNANTLYVDSSNTSPGNGLSWDCAFTDLQQALDVAQPGDSIWVAAGTYYPTSNSLDREATFQLRNGVAIYGGFAGNENSLDQRDWENNLTILSGDINQSNNLNGNSYTVVNGSGVASTAIMDGFTIEKGNAFGPGNNTDAEASGGGIYINNGSPSLFNLKITDNQAAHFGGGVFVFENSLPVLENSKIANNQAGSGGGIGFRNGSDAVLSNIEITNNTAISDGGGVYIRDCSPTILRSVISGNQSEVCGGIYLASNSSSIIKNSSISGNFGEAYGGIFIGFQCNPQIINSTITGNISESAVGGGMYIETLLGTTIKNSVIWNNSANGVTNSPSASIHNNSPNTVISSSIIANSGGSGDWNAALGIDGGNNFDQNPLFIEDFELNNVPTTSGDLRLQPCSPAIDRGDNDALAVSDSLDLDGNLRIRNATGADSAIVDMGPYEFQSTALMPEISCIDQQVYLDSNGDAMVIVNDLYVGIDSCGHLIGMVGGQDTLFVNCSDLGTTPLTIVILDQVSLRQDSCQSIITTQDN